MEKPRFDIENPTMKDFQEMVIKQKEYLGFNWSDQIKECFHLMEEVGELAGAVRRSMKGSAVDDASRGETSKEHIGEEIADCMIFLMSIANQHEVDIEEAFRNKVHKNLNRTWHRKK